MAVHCELCPVMYVCEAWDKADDDNRNSYHPQQVVRASHWDCPLLVIVSPKEAAEYADD